MPGVPARDLSDAEAAVYGGAGTLTATGLYEQCGDEAGEVSKRESRDERGAPERRARREV